MIGKVIGFHPEVDEGIYTVRYIGYETGRSWNGNKVMLKFAIVEGDNAGIELTRYYNAKTLKEPIGRGGSFEVGDRSYLVKEFRSMLPELRSISEIDLDHYKDKLIRVQVGSTNKTGIGEQLSESDQYSVIRKLIEVVPNSLEAESLTKLG